MKWIGDIADFSLRVHISSIFLLPVEVLVTDSESHIPIFCSSLMVIMALSGFVFETGPYEHGTDRRQTNDSNA